MSTTVHAFPTRTSESGATSSVLAKKAAFSTLVQRRNGAREPARVLYYRSHSLLRTLRQHLCGAA